MIKIHLLSAPQRHEIKQQYNSNCLVRITDVNSKNLSKVKPAYVEIRESVNGKQQIMLSLTGYDSQWPIQYDNGTIAYDTYNVPEYAKKMVKKAFSLIN
jgi:hypothetical protein